MMDLRRRAMMAQQKGDPYTITNLVTNGSFEAETTGWTAAILSMSRSDEQAYVGDYSLKTVTSAQAGTQVAKYSIALIRHHVYYLRMHCYLVGAELSYLQIRLNNKYKFGTNAVTTNNLWERCSGVYNGAESSATYQIWLENKPPTVAAGKTVYFDGVMAIDLTAAFGAGNEPTKEQCDEYITDWFDGTREFTFYM